MEDEASASVWIRATIPRFNVVGYVIFLKGSTPITANTSITLAVTSTLSFCSRALKIIFWKGLEKC